MELNLIMLCIPLEEKTYTINNLKYKVFNLKTDVETDYILKKGQQFSDEIAKYILYNNLLSKFLHSRIPEHEITLLMILYSDLAVSRHHCVPVDLQYINVLDLRIVKENTPVVEIGDIHLKVLNSTSVKCTIKIQLNIVNLSDLHSTDALDFVLYNNTLIQKKTMHLLNRSVKLNNFVCSINIHKVLKEFCSSIYKPSKKRKRSDTLVDQMIQQETYGNDILKKLHFSQQTIYFSKIHNILFYENQAVALGGIITCIDNHFQIFENYMKAIIKKKQSNKQNSFNGVILICKSFNKQSFKNLKIKNVQINEFRRNSNTCIKNAQNQVILISYNQLSDENRRWLLDKKLLPLSINLNNEKTSLLYMKCERLLLFDTNVLTFNNTDTNLLSSIYSTKKWVITSNSNKIFSKVDLFLFYRWLQPCRLLSNYQLQKYMSCILKKTLSNKIKELPVHFTEDGILKIKNSRLSLNKIINEYRTIDCYCSRESKNLNEQCCICYDSSNDKSFVEFKCKHAICIDCFKTINKNFKSKCPLCRSISSCPEETKIVSKDNLQIHSINPYTNKIEFLFVQLNFSPSIECAVVCNKLQRLLINNYFSKNYNDMLRRIHFVQKQDIFKMKLVNYNFVYIFNTHCHNYIKSNNINNKSYKLIDTVYTTY